MEGFDLRNLLNPEHWLAMDADGVWSLHKDKPTRGGWCWYGNASNILYLSKYYFNLPTCENWEDSPIQVKDLIKD